MRAIVALAAALFSWPAWAAKLTPDTARAFDRYIELTEAQLARTRTSGPFLWVDSHPEARQNARNGQTVVESLQTTDRGKPVRVPDGRIHDWLGALFIPHATIAGVRSVMQDYDNYKRIYKPDVIDSKLLRHNDDRFRVFLRLYKKQFLTLVYNAEYEVEYNSVSAGRLEIVSRSVRIAQVRDPAQSYTDEDPPGDDDGFLWRLNSYWRFEEADGGVYTQCRAISLSRAIPFGFGWLSGFLQQFPRDALVRTLEATVRAVSGR